MQLLKDAMKPSESQQDVPADKLVDCDAETDALGSSSSSGPIPDNFFGVVDAPPYDGSDSNVSDSDRSSTVEIALQNQRPYTSICIHIYIYIFKY